MHVYPLCAEKRWENWLTAIKKCCVKYVKRQPADGSSCIFRCIQRAEHGKRQGTKQEKRSKAENLTKEFASQTI